MDQALTARTFNDLTLLTRDLLLAPDPPSPGVMGTSEQRD